jgi:undecaprenyl-diphosphatase
MRQRSLQSRNGAVLLLLVGFVFSTLFFTVSFRLAEDFFPRSLTNFDIAMFRWFEGIRFASGNRILLAITRLGNTRTIVVVVSCVSLSFIVWRRHFEAALFGSGAALAALSMMTTKWLIGRPRPASPAVPVLDGNPAFPSGHVAVGGVVYVLLAYLVSRELRGRLSRALLLVFGVVIGLSLAWTRLYFGVHWMSDVLGGFALAGFWLALLTSLIIAHRHLHPLRVTRPSLWQIILQSVILLVLVGFLFRHIRP